MERKLVVVHCVFPLRLERSLIDHVLELLDHGCLLVFSFLASVNLQRALFFNRVDLECFQFPENQQNSCTCDSFLSLTASIRLCLFPDMM